VGVTVTMCRVYVLYCPSCGHFSPVALLSESAVAGAAAAAAAESRSRSFLVSDKRCKQFFCRRHLVVHTSWAPDSSRHCRWLLGSCGDERCLPRQCCVIPVYRDCCRPWRDCHPRRWFVRKLVANPPCAVPFFSLVQLERAWQGPSSPSPSSSSR